jgi:hypothetical protein
MKIQHSILALSTFALCSIFCLSLCGQNDPGNGWIEGIFVTDKGKPALRYTGVGERAAELSARPKEGNSVRTENDPSKDGFYSLRNLKPGIYEVFVNRSVQKDKGDFINYRPQHIFGVVVEPDKRTVLNITVHEGIALEEVGVSENAIILANELAHMRQVIENLKERADELKSDVASENAIRIACELARVGQEIENLPKRVKPDVASEDAIVLADELAHIGQVIENLLKWVDEHELKK